MNTITRPFSLVSIALSLLLACGCRSEAPPGEQLVQPTEDSKCAADAAAWFKENVAYGRFDKSTPMLHFSNHFQKSSHRCFIVVEYHLAPDPSLTTRISLWDITGNREYGAYRAGQSDDTEAGLRNETTTCRVDGKQCGNVFEFKKLITPYLYQ